MLKGHQRNGQKRNEQLLLLFFILKLENLKEENFSYKNLLFNVKFILIYLKKIFNQ